MDESQSAPEEGEMVRLPLDVSNPEQVRSLFSWIETHLGTIDVLINNAGVGHFLPLDETTFEQWQEMISTNLTGPFLCTQSAWPLLKNRGGGRIINMGSISGNIPLPNNGAYGASKFGLRGLSFIASVEGESVGIRVTLLSLGAVYSDIWTDRDGFSRDDMLPSSAVADAISYIVDAPLSHRIEELKLWPPKGVL